MLFALRLPASALALLAGCFTWLATALGAAAVFFFSKEKERLLAALLGFAAGVMLAASYWSLLAPAVDLAGEEGLPPWLPTVAGFLGGAAFLWGTDRLLGRLRPGEGERRAGLLLLSITLHNVPEGLAVGVAFGALRGEPSPERLLAAFAVALGIGIQNVPEGAAVSLPLLREGRGKLRSFLLGQASGLVEPAAALLGALLVALVRALLPWALSFAAGAMVLVAAHELIPGCRRDGAYLGTGCFIGGFAVMMLLDLALG